MKITEQKKKFEDWFFPILSDIMTSPNCAYAVTFIISYAVYKSPPTNLLELSQVLVQSYFQGVGLCILGYASALGMTLLMKKIDQMWEWLKEIKKTEHEIHKETHNKLDLILERLEQLENDRQTHSEKDDSGNLGDSHTRKA